MSYGRLCIASNIDANREGLGDNGIWVRPENVEDLSEKMVYVASNYQSLKTLEESNRNRVAQHFTWDIVAQRYVDYITSI